MMNNSKGIVSTHRTLLRGGKPPLFIILTVVAVTLTGETPTSKAQDAQPPYKNPQLSLDARVADLIGRMTVEEKARQLDMYFGCEAVLDTNQYTGRTHAKPDAVFNPEMAKKNLGMLGIGSIHDIYPRAKLSNRIQDWVIKSNRLGIQIGRASCRERV